MAIAIVSDLVLDVVRAADPERAKIAQAGLQRGAADKALAAEFADAVDMVRNNESIGQRAGMPSSSGENGIPALNEIARRTSPKEKAYEQFEATVLRSFVEEMLPKSTENTYGEGTAGGVWRSMQADFMSQELAKSGGIGIAASLARLDHSKTQALSGTHLNSISPRADGSAAIAHSIEWPYFGSSKFGALES
jgi:peptidoglycan hydrolase FlgJ